MRRKHFQRVRSAVAARLFAAKDNFLPALVEIMGHIADLRSVSFCSANPNHLHMLQGAQPGSRVYLCLIKGAAASVENRLGQGSTK